MGTGAVDHAYELTAAMARFTELAGVAAGYERVPACEEWAVRDLVEHLGTVHRWAAGIVLSGQRIHQPTPLVTGPVDAWYAGTAAALVAALHAVSPEESVPNFSRIGETAAFWPRRQMHETIVHTVDVQQALGIDEGQWVVPAAVAADGVDEVIEVFFPRMTRGGRRPEVRSRIRLVASDIDRSWIIAPGAGEDDTPVQLDRSGDADAVVTGTATDLYLALWHRVSRERLDFDGHYGIALLDGPTTP